MSIAKQIREATGRESIIEDIVFVLALRGAFNTFVGGEPTDIYRNRRGRPDVEIFGQAGAPVAAVGIEVKLRSQVNYGRYGGSTYVSQFDELSRHIQHLIIVTTAARIACKSWPKGATVMTLEDLAALVKEFHITADDIVSVALGHTA